MSLNQPGPHYQIRIRGRLHERWLAWFEGFTIRQSEDGETVLTGPAEDASALYGLLDRLRDLNLDLIEVRRISG